VTLPRRQRTSSPSTCRERHRDRAGAGSSAGGALVRRAVDHKELKPRINERGFVRPSRTMSQSGG
jgi:hypothetical protein